MPFFEIFNHFPADFPSLATCISAFVAFILGMFWYHPKVMGEKLAEHQSPETKNFKPHFTAYICVAALWFVTASIYAFLTAFLTPPTISALLGLSTFLWVGFVLPPLLTNGLFTGQKLTAIGIDSSYYLAGLYLFAVIHDVL